MAMGIQQQNSAYYHLHMQIHTTQKSIGNPMLDKAVKMHIIIGEEQRMTAAPQRLVYFFVIKRSQKLPSLAGVAVFFVAIF
ncbi:MAG: hypothetical protein IJ719_07190 [Clostridia bacterium]|nr:hypothetical protein [Clostridia bacterium]